MELCSGGDLSDYLKSDALPDTLAASFNGQLLSGLEFVHSHDLVHCDVKPRNVLLTGRSNDEITLKLTDFGLAHFCPRGERLHGAKGTPGYMSPQVLEGSFERACDLWACGCVLFQCLRGHRLMKTDLRTTQQQLAFQAHHIC